MEDDNLYKWKKSKDKAKAAAGICLIMFLFTFISAKVYKIEKLKFKTVILSKKPKFSKICVNGCSYSVEISFIGESKDYTINGIDYKYLIHRKFKKNVNQGDTVKLGLSDNNIAKISKNNIEYLRFEEAQKHKLKNHLFSRWLFLVGFISFMIPQFFNKRPKYTEDGITKEIHFGGIIFAIILITIIILLITIGITFVSGSEFIEY
ncbi:hypothetical protein UMM65_12490 [Aureibaculum sp. 2210JD6-5]|uniref:hypothetical protein n=1 Tax=Aureibaculum sp. 2210JD6-5 TaxID=3103957 RepID=UPI002AAD3E74|nr:hypothetical protein [Aureibaculum sp. 2210JD6-5]MDY7396063.1 hypothetical protein [Aureibaculum sp. 2210JD6-5]